MRRMTEEELKEIKEHLIKPSEMAKRLIKIRHKCEKLLDLIYDCYEKEDFGKIMVLLDIYGFDSVEELEDIVKGE